MSGILRNALKTPDGTVITSRHRHDYVTHTDTNGKEYIIDGGLDYIRSSANGDEEYLTVTINHAHDDIREACEWGSYGKDGSEPLHYKKLMDMSESHIEAVLSNVTAINPSIKKAMQYELEYRYAGLNTCR